MSKEINLVWFRNDLRAGDNPALFYAAEQGTAIGIYLEAEEQRKAHDDAACKIGFINDNVKELRKQLNQLNIPLHSFKVSDYAESIDKLELLVNQFNAKGVYFNNEYPLNEKNRDNQAEKILKEKGLEVKRFDGDIIIPPNSVATGQGEPYKVFTPYKKAWIEFHKTQGTSPLPKPEKQDFKIDEQHGYDFAQEYRDDLWPAGEQAAHEKLKDFLPKAGYYRERRDIPSVKGTSMLSPILQWVRYQQSNVLVACWSGMKVMKKLTIKIPGYQKSSGANFTVKSLLIILRSVNIKYLKVMQRKYGMVSRNYLTCGLRAKPDFH